MTKKDIINLLGEDFFKANRLSYIGDNFKDDLIGIKSKPRLEVIFRIESKPKNSHLKSVSLGFYKYNERPEIFVYGFFRDRSRKIIVINERVCDSFDDLINKKDVVKVMREYTHSEALKFLSLK